MASRSAPARTGEGQRQTPAVEPPVTLPHPVDLDHRDEVAERLGERTAVVAGRVVHVDLAPRLSRLLAHVPHQRLGIGAQVAPRPAIEDHPGLRHSPTVRRGAALYSDWVREAIGFPPSPGPDRPEPGPPVEPAAPPATTVAAFFDVDNTIIRGASAFHLAVGLWRRGFFHRRDIVRFVLHQTRYLTFGENAHQIDEVRSQALSLMRGHSVAEVIAVAEDVYDQVISLRIYPGTQALLERHLAAGHQVWLVTATPREIGDLIAVRLGATGALGTVAEHEDGFYTGRLTGDLMHGAAKATAVRALAAREGIDLSASYAYGDSTNDLPLLSSVGNPCAINPDTRLRRHAADVGWPMREFRRRTVKRSSQAASMAGMAWAAGLVLRSLRRRLRG